MRSLHYLRSPVVHCALSSGTYLNVLGQSVCASCGPGTIRILCALHVVSLHAALIAHLLLLLFSLLGTFTSFNASTNCTSCPPGTSQSQSAAVACVGCSAGQFSAVEGASQCALCAAGSVTHTETGRQWSGQGGEEGEWLTDLHGLLLCVCTVRQL